MVYVWLTETSGKKRYVNDDFLNPCYKCGEKISVCQANNCLDEPEEEDKGCQFCGVMFAQACHCDADYEDVAGK